MHFLSAVIITYNEEKNIAGCIEALLKVADEVIVVDSFSSDNTVSICESLKAKVYLHKWEGFGIQKRFAIAQASYNNIIALDADEILDEKAISEILKLKEQGFNAVYEIKLHHYYFGKFLNHGQEYPNYKTRIFNKEFVTWNENKVHESLIIPMNYPVIKLKGRIDHFSYHTIEQYIAKSNLYTNIAANELYKKGKKNYLLKMIFSPSFTFLKSYFLKAGLLDGFHGFIIAILNAYTNFLKYAKLRELKKHFHNNP